MLFLLFFLLGGVILGFAVTAWINHSTDAKRRAIRRGAQVETRRSRPAPTALPIKD